MKKIYIISAIAATVFAASCKKAEVPACEQGVTVSFTGEMAEDVKTYLDPTTFQVKFNKGDQFHTAAIPVATPSSYKAALIKVTSEDGSSTAQFETAKYDVNPQAEVYFFAGTQHKTGYPSPSNLATKGYIDYKIYSGQKITAKGPLGVAADGVEGMPLVSLYAVTEKFPSMPESVQFQFHHIFSYGNLRVTNLNLSEGDQVTKVKISSTTRYFTTKAQVKSDGSLASNVSSYNKYLDLDVTDMNITSGNFNVVFVTAPVDVSQTTTTVAITTKDGKTFTRNFMAPSGKGKFQVGHLLPFTVDFTGVAAN